eukprot:1684874-Rhodomonas_salina.1
MNSLPIHHVTVCLLLPPLRPPSPSSVCGHPRRPPSPSPLSKFAHVTVLSQASGSVARAVTLDSIEMSSVKYKIAAKRTLLINLTCLQGDDSCENCGWQLNMTQTGKRRFESFARTFMKPRPGKYYEHTFDTPRASV